MPRPWPWKLALKAITRRRFDQAIERQKKREEKAQLDQVREEKKAAEAAKPGLTYEQRKELNRLEKEISKLEAKKEDIHAQFNATDLTQDKIKELSQELKAIDEKIEEKELRWMELAEEA